jgi:hypothetical protein
VRESVQTVMFALEEGSRYRGHASATCLAITPRRWREQAENLPAPMELDRQAERLVAVNVIDVP